MEGLTTLGPTSAKWRLIAGARDFRLTSRRATVRAMGAIGSDMSVLGVSLKDRIWYVYVNKDEFESSQMPEARGGVTSIAG